MLYRFVTLFAILITVSASGMSNAFAASRQCFTQQITSNVHMQPPNVSNNQRVYWWIGDSRFVGMAGRNIIGAKSDEAVLAKVGEGLKWFNNTAKSKLTGCVNPGDVVILGLGVNDLANANSYISTYNQLINSNPNVTFKVLSVNPVYDGKTRYVKNKDIVSFNSKLKGAFSSRFVDTYSILKSQVSASNTDGEGLHYRDKSIERTVYNTVMASVGGGGTQPGTTPTPPVSSAPSTPPSSQPVAGCEQSRCANLTGDYKQACAACCHVSSSVAKWDATTKKCNCVQAGKVFDVAHSKCVAKPNNNTPPKTDNGTDKGVNASPKDDVVTPTDPKSQDNDDAPTDDAQDEENQQDDDEAIAKEGVAERDRLMREATERARQEQEARAQQERLEQQKRDALTKNIEELSAQLSKFNFKKSHWKNASGGFNTARLASDSIAGVVLGTAGGLITSSVVKKNQTKSGFDNMQCTINGQSVASYGDDFVIGTQAADFEQ